MKKYLQFKLLVIGLIISSSLTFAQVAPTLGVAADFVLFSSIGAVTNVGSSKVTGNVGSNSGAVSGFGNVNGQMHNGNGVTAATASALNTAYLAIGSQTPTIFPAVLLGGQTFTPAVIQVAAPSSIVGTLTLNGLGNPNAVFIIKLNGAFSMAASAKIVLINGAKACNVFWKIEGLVTIATGASLVGNFIVNGEIVLGAGTQLEGRAMSIVGAITVNGVKASTPIGCGSPVLNGPALPNIGRTGCYALLTANGALTSTGTTQIVGDVGTNLGPVSGFVPLNVIGTIHSVPDTSTAGAAADLGVLYTNLNALPFDIQLLYPAQFGNSQVLTPHTYRMIGAAALTDTIFLDALGNPNAVFVIQINGALTTSTYAKVILQGGTKASNVFWKVEGLVTMGTYTTFQGTLVVNNAAIVMNIGDTLNGRGLSTVGAITANSAVVRITGGGGSSVSASGPLNFCEGDSVTLTAGSSSSYKWSRGDTTQSIKVKVSGTHYVITNSCAGKDTSANIVVIVSALPTALITPLGISNLCMGDSVLLKTKDSIGLSYQWQRDTVNIVGANDSMYWAKTAGNYTVKVTNVANCSKTSPIKIVNFNPYPVANINNVGPLTFCQGDSVKLVSDTLSGLTRQWKRNGVNILNATDSIYYASVSGNYTLQVTNAGNCSSLSNSKNVTVNAKPVAVIYTLTPTTFCQGDSVKLRTNSNTGLTYIWKKDGITILGAIDSIYTANATGSYVVVITNVSMCNATSLPTLVNAILLPSAVINNVGPLTYCQGDSVKLVSDTLSGLTRQWKRNGVNILNATDSIYYASVSGNYTLQVTNAGNCSSLSNSKNVTVNAKPVAVIYTLTPTSFCQGDSVKLRTNSNIGLTYIWKKDGITILGAIDSIYTAKATGSYVVVITNVSMCNATSLPASVNVVPYPIVVVTLTGASTFCQGDSALLSTSIGSGLTYQWRNASTDILGAINNTLTVKQTGAYMVRVTNSTNCSTNSLVQNITVNPLPIVVIKPSGPVSFCMGDSVKLASDTISGLNRQWKRNGVNILNATDSIYYVTIAGSYTLQVTNASNCMATSSAKVVTVNANNLATITTLTPTTFCAGDSVKLRTNSGIGYTYIWRRDGIIIPGAIDSIYTAKVSGSYVVTINNTFGCNAISAPQLVVVVPFPIVVVVLTGPSTFCQGDSALLSTTFGVGLSYQWRNAGIDIFGATSNSLTVKQSGSYLVRVTNFNNCATNSLPQNILVNPLPTAIITSNDTNSFCQGDSIRLSANRASGLSYQWLRNNVEILNALDSFYVANTSGNYTVSITNSNSCVNTSAAYVVNVNPIPLAEITASGPLSFCIGDSITLTANNEFSYRWSTNQTTRSINVSASGAYSVTVTSIFGCKNTSLVSVVTVNPLPLALTGPDKTLVRGGSVLIGVAPVAGNSYLWTPSLGLSATDISQPRANPMDTTTYYLTETINLTGCSNTNSVRVNVVLDIEFFNGFSPNGDGFNDTWNIPILNYFPENTVTINNRWGSEVWSLKNYNSATNAWDGKNMNGDDLPDGTYFYIVTYYNTEKRGWVFIKR